jgi:chorismate synthase
MSNTFGTLFKLTTWGESHGPAIGCIIDGCPSGLTLKAEDIQKDLDRRRPGQSTVTTGRNEPDKAEILSGIFEGKTTGTPISIQIKNTDQDPSKYANLKTLVRPSQADYAWREKYGSIDYRGGGRYSGRETATRVAGGAIAKKILSTQNIEIIAYTKEIAGVGIDTDIIDYSNTTKLKKLIESNLVRSPDPEAAKIMEHAIQQAKKDSDSVGGIIEAIAFNVPAGLGEPIFDKISADLAKAMLTIPAVKAFEIGAGLELARMRGSQANDAFTIVNKKIRTETNNSGGIQGGITNGMPIIIRIALKPTASIAAKQHTVDIKKNKNAEIQIIGRHDPCIVPRAVPVAEAMMALVITDHALMTGKIQRKL